MLCTMRDAVARMDAHPVDKDRVADKLRPLRDMFGRSLAPVTPMIAGTILTPAVLTCKKPTGGIPPDSLLKIAGRRLARDVTPERILRWEDLLEDDCSDSIGS
jgi:N-acetylneuraminate synthase